MLGPYSTVQRTASLDEVLDDPEVQAVAIATPAATHLAVALAALEAGKHVLVEKPLAATYEEGLELVEAAEERGLGLMCDHTYCYTPAVQQMRELVHSGDLGDVQYVDSVRINLGLVQPDIDVLWDLAPHDLSILDSILPDGVHPGRRRRAGLRPDRRRPRLRRHLTLQLSNGAIAHAHVNWLSPDQDPHDDRRRLPAHGGLGRPQPVAAHSPSTTGASTRPDGGPTDRSSRSPTAPATWSRRRCPSGEALRGVMAEFAAVDHREAGAADRRPVRPAGAGHARRRVREPGARAARSCRCRNAVTEERP